MLTEESKLSETEFSKILDFVSQKIGIVPIEAHRSGIKKFVEERTALLKKEKNIQNNFSYLTAVYENPDEVQALIDAATVNETYFFREQKQFEFLKQEVYPKITAKKGEIKIWSAACSSGEEPYSLLLLADSMNLKTTICASDVNTHALEKCRKGVYKKSSVKTFDGNQFNHLVNKFWKDKTEDFENGAFVIPEALREKIEFKQLNLMDCGNAENLKNFPENQDLIFARNIFIYFPRETKKMILKQLAENCLAEGGYLFVSMNETAGIDREILPECLERKFSGSVFYFQKKIQERSGE